MSINTRKLEIEATPLLSSHQDTKSRVDVAYLDFGNWTVEPNLRITHKRVVRTENGEYPGIVTGKKQMNKMARNYLANVFDNRRHVGKEDVPLIFVGHKTDGLFLKKMLESKELVPKDEEEGPMSQVSRTYGIIHLQPKISWSQTFGMLVILSNQLLFVFALSNYKALEDHYRCFGRSSIFGYIESFWPLPSNPYSRLSLAGACAYSLAILLCSTVQLGMNILDRYQSHILSLGILCASILYSLECSYGHALGMVHLCIIFATWFSTGFHMILRRTFQPMESIDDVLNDWTEDAISRGMEHGKIREITLLG
jgi:hypothetical protein